jgi:hypothetical protein
MGIVEKIDKMKITKHGGWDKITEGRPTIEPDETLVYRAFEAKVSSYLIGIVATFIPPFILGPLIILGTYYIGRHSGIMVTNKRLVVFTKNFSPKKYSVIEFPLNHLISVRMAGDIEERILNRLMGAGNIRLEWEDHTGTRSFIATNIRKPKLALRAIKEVRQKLEASDRVG